MPNVAKIRAQFSEAVNRVAYGSERIVIEKNGKPVAALVDMSDYELLLAHERMEDRLDAIEVAKAMANPGTAPWRTLDGEAVPPPKPNARARRWLARQGRTGRRRAS